MAKTFTHKFNTKLFKDDVTLKTGYGRHCVNSTAQGLMHTGYADYSLTENGSIPLMEVI
jgi:hypothetical protein